ncbi:MAG: tetratricopeptide repeat protein, partial [bacterium]
SLDPDYEQALFNLAGWYMANNNVQETKKILNRIIKINPKNTKAINALNSLKS